MINKKKICIFTGDMSRSGGTERCTAFLANALSKLNKKYTIYVLNCVPNTKSLFFALEKNVSFCQLPPQRGAAKIFHLAKFLRRESIDVLINVECELGIYSVPATLFCRTKNIIWEHGNFYQKRFKGIDLLRKIEILLCSKYVVLTQRDRDSFIKRFGKPKKITYIYNPVTIKCSNAKYAIDSKTILSVGIVRYIKGFDMLVEVAKKVFSKHPDWEWKIYGDPRWDSDFTKEIVCKIKEYNLTKNLFLMGETTDINNFYRAASMFVMTSRMEGLPMVLLEAKAFKSPIISFDIQNGPSEIVSDGINGYLIQSYDVDKMANKICELIESPSKRTELSQNSVINIEKFNENKILEKWNKLIDEAIC